MYLRAKSQFKLLIPEPFDFRLTVAKPAGWHWSTLDETFENGVFWSGLYLRGRPVGLKMSASRKEVNVIAYSRPALSPDEVDALKTVVQSGLGADEDLSGFYQFARNDPILSRTVADLYGMRIGLLDDVFGRVILAILLQMAPLARSGKMMEDTLEYYGKRIIFDGKEITLWPQPADIAGIDTDVLRSKANLGYRAKRLVEAARFLAEHPISLLELSRLPEEEALKRLIEIPGIGKYSAGIIFGRTSVPIDAWSVVIMSELILGRTPQNPRKEIDTVVARLTESWGKWRWFAFVYIANDLEKLSKTYKLSRLH